MTVSRYIIALMFMLMLSGCTRDAVPEPSGKIVKIGVIGSFSGADKALSDSGLNGVEVVLSLRPLLNNGDKVELLVEDDRSQPDEVKDAFDRLVDQDVAGVILLSRSEIAMKLADKIWLKKAPVLATVASHSELTAKGDYITQVSFDDTFQGSVAAMFARDELFIKRVAVISDPDDIHSTILAETFIDKFEAANGVVLRHITLDDAEIDLQASMQELKREDAELLYAPVKAQRLLELARVLQGLPWKPDVITSDGLLSEIFLKHKEDVSLVDGMMVTDMHSTQLTLTEYGEAVMEAFNAQNKGQGSALTILACEGTSMLLDALNECDSDYGPRIVQQELRGITRFSGFYGSLTIDSDGKVRRPVYVSVIRGEELELLVKVY